jgi:hypothetical protein
VARRLLVGKIRQHESSGFFQELSMKFGFTVLDERQYRC